MSNKESQLNNLLSIIDRNDEVIPAEYYGINTVKSMLIHNNYGADSSRVNSIKSALELIKYLFELGATDYKRIFIKLVNDSQICVWVINRFKITREFFKPSFTLQAQLPIYILAGAWRLIPGAFDCLDLTDRQDVEKCNTLRVILSDVLLYGVADLVLDYIAFMPSKKCSAEEYIKFNNKLFDISNKWLHGFDDDGINEIDDGIDTHDDYAPNLVDEGDPGIYNANPQWLEEDAEYYNFSASARHYREDY